MIEEALKYLADQARTAAKAVLIPIPEDKTGITYHVGNYTQRFEWPIPPRTHNVLALDDLIQAANRFGGDDLCPVWVSFRRVACVIDDAGHRRNTVTFEPVESDVFRLLRKLRQSPTWHEPKPFVRMLRVELAGTLDPVSLLNAVKTLRFDNGVAVKAENSRTREGYSREATAEARGTSEIPDEVTLDVPVYSSLGERTRFPLRCSVDVNPVEGKLQLMPIPDEIERVEALAMRHMMDRLEAGLTDSIPRYFGTP